MLVREAIDALEREEQNIQDAYDHGYICGRLFLDGPQNQAKIEADPRFIGYLRYMIKVDPKNVPALVTDEAKMLYKLLREQDEELRKAQTPNEKKEEEIIFPPVIIPDYEIDAMNDCITVDPEELKPVEEETSEEEVDQKEESDRISLTPKQLEELIEKKVQESLAKVKAKVEDPKKEEPQTKEAEQPHPSVKKLKDEEPKGVWNFSAYQQPQKPEPALEEPLDISDKTMLQLIYNCAWQVGLEAFFFQEPKNNLVKICYVTTDGSNQRCFDDWLDPNAFYFPEPVIIPNKAVPILYQPYICIQENTLRNYMQWKRSPMSAVAMNEWIYNYTPDRLITDVCYNTHPIVNSLDAANVQLLKTSLIGLFTFLDSNHQDLVGIRWEFDDYKAPDNFVLRPEKMDPSVRGLITYTSRQTIDVKVAYNANNTPRVLILNDDGSTASTVTAEEAEKAANSLKESLSKGNPAKKTTKTTVNKSVKVRVSKPKKTSSKKVSEEEKADAEVIALASN